MYKRKYITVRKVYGLLYYIRSELEAEERKLNCGELPERFDTFCVTMPLVEALKLDSNAMVSIGYLVCLCDYIANKEKATPEGLKLLEAFKRDLKAMLK